jgi:ribosomal protein S19
MKRQKALKSFTIDDNVTSVGSVEVTIELHNGQQRWCFFITPESLGKVGDFVPDTDVRIHLGVQHMIVVSQLDEEIIEKALNYIDYQGRLEEQTILLS